MKISASLPDLRRPRSRSSYSTSSVISHSGAPRTGASLGSERTFTNVLLRTASGGPGADPAARTLARHNTCDGGPTVAAAELCGGRAEEDARSSDGLHVVLPSIGDRGSVASL